MYKVKRSKDFDLGQIANSGQCFRINKVGENQFSIVAQGKLLIVDVNEDSYLFHCTEHQFDKRWRGYFDLDTDYRQIKEIALNKHPEDKLVADAISYAPGMRILKQEPWEAIVSFIVSQRKNIPAIKKSIESICEKYGNFIGTYKGKDYYSFPSPYSIVSGGMDQLKETGVGYRADYIMKAAEAVIDGSLSIVTLQGMSHENTMEYLMKFKGIGTKVANCISLYGLHHLDAFPKDIWMQRMIDEDYHGSPPEWSKEDYAGAIQQYVFYYKRSLAKGGNYDTGTVKKS